MLGVFFFFFLSECSISSSLKREGEREKSNGGGEEKSSARSLSVLVSLKISLSLSLQVIMTTSLELPGVRLAGRGGLVSWGEEKSPLPLFFAESMLDCALLRKSFPPLLPSLSLSSCSLSRRGFGSDDPCLALTKERDRSKKQTRSKQRAPFSFCSDRSHRLPFFAVVVVLIEPQKKKKKTDRRRPPLHALGRRLEKSRQQRRRRRRRGRARHLRRGPRGRDRFADLDADAEGRRARRLPQGCCRGGKRRCCRSAIPRRPLPAVRRRLQLVPRGPARPRALLVERGRGRRSALGDEGRVVGRARAVRQRRLALLDRRGEFCFCRQ